MTQSFLLATKPQHALYGAPFRTQILWIGGEVPLSLKLRALERGFTMDVIASEIAIAAMDHAVAISKAAPTARTILIEFSGQQQFSQQVAEIVQMAHRHGLLVGLTHADDVRPNDYFDAVLPVVSPAPDRTFAPYRDWDAIVARIASHDPAGGASPVLKIEGLEGADAEVETLIRRAFHDMEGVRLEPLRPGKSGASVWALYATGDDARNWPHPFLVKLGTIPKMQQETYLYHQAIKQLVHSRHHPHLHPERYVEGERRAVVVQDFVDSALPLRTALCGAAPAPIFSSLFFTALRACHQFGGDTNGSLPQAFTDLKALLWSSKSLSEAASEARQVQPSVHSLVELRTLLESADGVRYRQGWVHGDLHADNIFVSSSLPIVIDFGNAMIGPVVADAACLEVSLTFPPREMENNVFVGANTVGGPREAWIRSLYKFPLHMGAVMPLRETGPDLATAVATIRGSAHQLEPDVCIYAIAVAAYLLRYASFDDHATRCDRALAYELASALTEAAVNELLLRRQVGGAA